MKDTTNYVSIMKDTLKKKIEILKKIEKVAMLQTKAFEENNIDAEKMMAQLEQKDVYIKELEKLDEGFETVYTRAYEDIQTNKEEYKDDIISMQEMIKEIASYTVKLKVYEEKNRPRFVALFEAKRKEIKNFNVNSKMASEYYKNMANIHRTGQSYFVDSQK